MINGKKDTMAKVAVDIDDTLLYFYEPWLNFVNGKYRTNFSINDIKVHSLDKSLKMSEPQVINEIFSFYQSPRFTSLRPVEGAVYATKELSRRKSLGIITSRPDSTSFATTRSLQKHFPGIFSEIHFTSQFGGNGHRQNKSQFCLDYGYRVIVEDVAEYANECAENGIPGILLTKPWNVGESLHPLVTRVPDWKVALEVLK